METETIAAVATALSESGISIIRVSGSDAVSIVDKIFETPGKKHILSKVQSHTIHYGFLYDKGRMIDEVMVSILRAPRSYTAEDTVEINCHGGLLLTNRILELVLENGARLADPGEFTKRAFLNGRIDLSKAEAVMDLIRSDNDMAIRSSVSQLRGSVSAVIKKLREKMIYEIAFIESAIDDPEHISTEGYSEKLSRTVSGLIEEVERLLDHADNGRIIKNGIKTVILGKPNVGKSSLMNLLAGEEKAIVTDIAGTTRDILEESVRIRGIGLKIIDTAGIRFTEDLIEKIGVEKAISIVKDADLILYVADSSIGLDKNDVWIFDLIKDRNAIVLLNKSDLPPVIGEEEIRKEIGGSYPIIKISAMENKGIDELEEQIEQLFFHGRISFENEVILTNIRHKEAVKECLDSLKLVQNSIAMGMPEDFYSIDLMNAYASLGKITGEEVGEDLIHEIFSKFCIGK